MAEKKKVVKAPVEDSVDAVAVEAPVEELVENVAAQTSEAAPVEAVAAEIPAEALAETAATEDFEEAHVENVAVEAPAAVVSVQKPSFGKRVGAGVKEWFRKFIVKLKRKPMNIGLFVLAISAVVLLCSLGSISQLGLLNQYSKMMQGLCIFIDTLFGILVLLLYMNAFPKRSKKPKWVMYVLTIVFMVVLIGLDLYLYIIWGINRAADIKRNPGADYLLDLDKFYYSALGSVLAHAILVAISLVLMVLSPVIGKLLKKINTNVVLEESQLKNEIEVEED